MTSYAEIIADRQPLPAPLPGLLLAPLGVSRLHVVDDAGQIATLEAHIGAERSVVEVLSAQGMLQSHSGQPARVLRGLRGERREWFDHGRLSRRDGPAVVEPDGAGEWWWDGVPLSDPQTGSPHPLVLQPVSGATVTVLRLQITLIGAPVLTAWGKRVERTGEHPGQVFVHDLTNESIMPLAEADFTQQSVAADALFDQPEWDQPSPPLVSRLAALAQPESDPETISLPQSTPAGRRAARHRPQRYGGTLS
jgi:hypothetical protein